MISGLSFLIHQVSSASNISASLAKQQKTFYLIVVLTSATTALLCLTSFNTASDWHKHCFGVWNANCASLKPPICVIGMLNSFVPYMHQDWGQIVSRTLFLIQKNMVFLPFSFLNILV